MKPVVRAGWLVVGVVVVVGYGVALELTGGEHGEVPHPPPCTAPSGEAQVLRDYAREPVLVAKPRPDANPPSPYLYFPVTYCKNIGVDGPHPALYTLRESQFQTVGYWPSATLRTRYDRLARSGGWPYVRQADADPDGVGCFAVTLDNTGFCQGSGVEYCKVVDGVVSFLDISSASREDIPGHSASVTVDIVARWDLRACPPAG